MKKEQIRKEFFKLRIKGHSYSQCKKILLAQFGYDVTTRTLQRWDYRSRTTFWDLNDISTRPKILSHKISKELEERIISIRKQTGFGEKKIANYVEVGHTSIYKVLNRNGLIKSNQNKPKRIKYIRWQRKHPNSLWQMDISDQKVDDKYCFAVIDDCSRYCIGLIELNQVTTPVVTQILDELGRVHGYPREILTDNGNVFGLRSKHSKFDRWCRKRGIKHIRTAIHSPTTTGKIERFFQTLGNEVKFCRNLQDFRMRYNHFRPHTSINNKNPSDIYFPIHMLL